MNLYFISVVFVYAYTVFLSALAFCFERKHLLYLFNISQSVSYLFESIENRVQYVFTVHGMFISVKGGEL